MDKPEHKITKDDKERLINRLESLYSFLDSEGWYQKAYTAALALEEIKKIKIQ